MPSVIGWAIDASELLGLNRANLVIRSPDEGSVLDRPGDEGVVARAARRYLGS